MTRHELHQKDMVITPLIFQGQSPYQIITNHPELDMSVRTLYSYLDKGILSARNIDLKRQVKFNPRKVHKTQIIYYCDPMRSGQKGGIEQAHTMLRMILPKKTSFEYLTQWDLRTIVDHINSTPRESLGGRTPYDVALENYGIDILKALQLRPIPPDEVNLTPKLIRFNH